MKVFRMHIKPASKTSRKRTFEYCLENNLLGVGWRVPNLENTDDWNKYSQVAIEKYGKVNQCEYIKKHIKKDDLIWTRDKEKGYYLAKVASGWEYYNSESSIEEGVDISNIVRVNFVSVPIDAVPGKVIACFRSGRSCQVINSKVVNSYSRSLWNQLSNDSYYSIDEKEFHDIFELLDDEETEDLVFLYLQSKGWYIVPNSRKGDTMSFEFLAIDPKTGQKALTQVKTGGSTVPRSFYTNRETDEQIFIFQSNEKYEENLPELVTAISRDELISFLKSSQEWLPEYLIIKMKASKLI